MGFNMHDENSQVGDAASDGQPEPVAPSQIEDVSDDYEDDEYEDDYDDEYEYEPGPRDPAVALMIGGVMALILVLIVTAGSMVAFLLSLRHAPRTYAEMSVTKAEAQANLQPGVADNWIALAYAYAQGQRYNDALSAVERGRVVGKDKMDLVNADVLRLMGRQKDALTMYDQAINYIETQDKAAYLAQARRRIYTAMPDMNRGIAYFGRGMTRIALNDPKDAIKDLLIASAINPNDVTIMIPIGDSYAKLGDFKNARKWYKKAVSMSPDYDPAVQALAKIQGR